MNTDIRNNPLTGASTEQAEHYNDLLQDYIDYRASVFKDLKLLCLEAPEFAMAHLFKAYMLLSMGTLSTVGAAKQCIEDAKQNAADLSEQENLHIEAATAWAEGNTTHAVDIWEQIIFASPRDLLVMKLHHFALFWLGQPQRMLSTCNQVTAHWDQKTPGYANYLGMTAFAEEESGNYAVAEKLSREAIERAPDDLWSLHALAHIFEMQGRVDEGIALLDAPLDQYDDRNPFRGHLWWHFGMFLVEKGQFDRALDIYDKAIYADQSSFYLDLQNTASFLARLELCNINVGDRWQALGEVVKDRQGDHVLAFTEPHHTIILARCEEFGEITKQLNSLENLSAGSDSTMAKLVQPLLTPLCEAVRDFYLSSYKKAGDRLAGLQSQLINAGGSHAQRDLFNLMQLQSVIDQQNFPEARQLLKLRLEQRSNSAINWHQYASLCRATGDDQEEQLAMAELKRIAGVA